MSLNFKAPNELVDEHVSIGVKHGVTIINHFLTLILCRHNIKAKHLNKSRNVNKVYDGTASLGSGAITIGNTGVLHPERILVSATAVDAGTYALSAANLYSVQNGYDLTLTGLRFNASLGVLAQEIDSPQPILVDAELNMGSQPLLPRDDEILNVLDYRKVRQAIIEECNAVHVNLLETMIGKLCNRLMGMPGVLGVRVKIAKLEIFDDCEVAIRMETGQW